MFEKKEFTVIRETSIIVLENFLQATSNIYFYITGNLKQ